MERWKVLNTIPGQYSVGHHSLFNKNIVKVKRGGKGFDIVGSATVPNAVQVSVSVLNVLVFETTQKFQPGEKVYALYN